MMSAPQKYYYKGYECNAVYQPQRQAWLCKVENVTHPFAFELREENNIQPMFEREVEDYINRCYDKGVEPKRSFMDAAQRDRHTALTESLRKSHQQREKKQQQKEREFQRSPWRYAVAAVMVGIPALGYFMLATIGRVVPFTMFFPYRADVPSKRLPLLTLLVCVICWVVFVGQVISENRYEAECEKFLALEDAQEYKNVFDRCWDLEYLRRSSEQPEAALRDIYMMYLRFEIVFAWGSDIELDIDDLLFEDESNAILQNVFPLYELHVAPAFNDDVKYWPNRGDVSGAITAMFAHADFEHILFNLIFFFAFAATVERLAGHGFFLALFAVTGFFDGVLGADSVLGSGLELGVPSLGLSGVCSAFLGALLVLKHNVRIQTFFWFLITIRTFLVPVWFLAAWYISFDVMNMLNKSSWGGTGYLAHVVGAFSGIGCAVFYKYLMLKKVNVEALAS